MMNNASELLTDSRVNLVSSSQQDGSSEPKAKKLRLGNIRTDGNGNNNVSQDLKKKSRLFGKFKIGKSRKIGHHNGNLNKVSVKTRKIGTSVEPTSNGLLSMPRDSAEMKLSAKSKEEEKRDLRSSITSVFGKKEHELNVNLSQTTKLMYFGFLLPAMAVHPDSLKECDTPKFDEDLKLRLAVAHINDAIHSRGKFGHARALMRSKSIQKCYAIISSPYWEYLIYLFIGLHCFMAFWEQSPVPTTIRQQWAGAWVMNLSVLVLDALCTFIYVVDIVLWIRFLSWTHFWSAKENFWMRYLNFTSGCLWLPVLIILCHCIAITKICFHCRLWVEFVFTAMFLTDYVIIVLQRVLGERLIAPFRCLRAAMLLCKSKNVSHIFKVLISIMSKLGKVFAIILIFIFTFASIGLHLYMNDYHDISQACPTASQTNCTSVYSGAFDNIAIASVHMFVLMSTENYPDIIIPAFLQSIANFFYFMFYLYAGVFFLTAILLAIIVESYWEYSKKHVKMERLRQREELIRAWNLLDLNGTGFLSMDNPKLLRVFSLLKPKNTEDQNLQLIEYMGENNQDYAIDSYDWATRLVQTLSIEFESEIDENSLNGDSTATSSCHSRCSKIIHADGIGMAILVLILLHSIFFCLMWSGITATTQLALQASRTAIVFVFVVEVILRIISDGGKLLNVLDVLDIIMVMIAVAGNVTWYILWPITSIPNPQLYLGACVVTSALAVLARLLFNSEQARSAIHILSSIYPVMFDLILLVVIIIYFYAILGLEIFQDTTLEKSNEQGFEGSYVQYNCGVGFETFGCALMIVFQIVTTNDWHQIMLGAMIDAGWASAFYFISCYLIIDMIVMNLFVAISIEAYKKLARDDKAITAKPESPDDTENPLDGTPSNECNLENAANAGSRPSKDKLERTLGAAAKDAFTGIFASTRSRKTSNPPVTAHNTPATMPFNWTGPRGSIAIVSVHTDSSDDSDSADDTILSHGTVPGSPRWRNRTFRFPSDPPSPRKRSTSSNQADTSPNSQASSDREKIRATPIAERRQNRMKARSELVRKERKARQKQMQQFEHQQSSANTLNIPTPKMSISDVVKLKKMVRILKPYNAKSSLEMNVEEGQMFSISEENRSMYRGPGGWFPKEIALDIDINAGDGPFAGKDNVRSVKKKPSKVVNFKIENETTEIESSSTGRLAPSPNPPHRVSIQRMRMRKDGNDWRRDILGDMTVMNRQEAQALQKRLKGGRMNFERHQSRYNLNSDVSRLSLIHNKKTASEIMQQTIDEKEEDSTPEVPILKVSEPQSSSEASGESNENTNASIQKTDTLTVPSSSGTKSNKPKGNGEMPEWMKNFAASTGVTFQNDLKFDESSLRSTSSSDDDDRLDKLLHERKVSEIASSTSSFGSHNNIEPNTVNAVKGSSEVVIELENLHDDNKSKSHIT